MYEKALKWAMNLLIILASLAMSLMILVIVADVIGREFFNSPLTGGYELVEVFMGILCPVSVTYCIYREEDICVDLFYQHLPVSARKGIRCFANLFVLLVGTALLWQSWHLVQDIIDMETSTALLSIAMWPIAVCVFLSFLVMIPLQVRFLFHSFSAVEKEEKNK
ncbi:MAG: TRAP transporter small permease [Mailhella sp.]